MTLTGIPADLQLLLVLDYEGKVKTILMVGWFLFSLFYLLYWYKRQEPTKLFFLGTFRASMYVTAWLYSWLFWLIYPVFLHPNVPIDNLLIFLGAAYSSISTIFFVIFVFNFTIWVPRFIVKFGKLDVLNWESEAFKSYFGKGDKIKWLESLKK